MASRQRRPGSDEDLLRSFLDGDESAFEDLVGRHEDRIFGLAVRMLGDRGDALDATQDTFVSAFRQASSFRGDSSFGTWLYRIGVNACKDLLRKKRRWGNPEEDVGVHTSPGSTSVEDSVSSRVDIARALALIPEEYREAVVMHDLGGIGYQEIAVLTHSKIGTVKSRISRGRRKLAELLEQAPSSETSKDAT